VHLGTHAIGYLGQMNSRCLFVTDLANHRLYYN
jgi:hypothetical protein